MKRSFLRTLLRLNDLAGACSGWQFLPGMLFKEKSAWWRDGLRQSPHEGIDLLFLAGRDGQRRQLPPQALVAPLWAGEVVAVFEDFLGSTMVVCHPVVNRQGWKLHSLYGHVRPLTGLGSVVAPEEPLAEVSAGKVRGAQAPPDHLHLSLAWLAPAWPAAELCWPGLWNNPGILLLDPLAAASDSGRPLTG